MSAASPSFWQDMGWRIEALFYDLFVALMRLLPVDTASDLGGWLLKVIGPVSPVQKTVRRNIDIAFPEKDEAWKARVIRDQWENLGRTFAEFAIMDRITIANGRIVVEGREHLRAIVAAGKPVVFISGHFANWEAMPSAIIDSGARCRITYRQANNPYVDQRIKEGRRRYGIELFAAKGEEGARELLEAMHEGQSVALMNDQKFNRGIPTPFFGTVADTAPGPTRLALRFGTVLQPLSIERLHKARFRVTAHEPITVEKTGSRAGDIEATVLKVSAFVEEVVCARPEQWFWVHKRWPNAAYKIKHNM